MRVGLLVTHGAKLYLTKGEYVSLKRRLIVCLDGTWNNRDDSTNVLYAHSLARECQNLKTDDGSLVTQQHYYQEGVGTGPLDRLTGGGFGIGLEEHVRDAYDWLVHNYREGNGTKDEPPDEIYIFGFSRGAYTARSLVGFIGTCGLLRRGAPLTVNQLWENYCILGLEREERSAGLVEKIFGSPEAKFRRITELLWDPWGKSGLVVPGAPLRLKCKTATPTEKLLMRWSRRVRITYLGVYDTVGAMGWDALAIPGLRSKLAVHHNMRPTTIIQKCRHALAIDEHRSSFGHTPFVAYIGAKTLDETQETDSSSSTSGRRAKMRGDKWQDVEKKWNDKIEQRWFVGAHSNIGGGYPNNLLAQRPLQWIMEGAQEAGLICDELPPVAPIKRERTSVRDSYAEFAAPFWTMIFRAKRNYRPVDPAPELRASRGDSKSDGQIQPGFSLVSVNETVDESVLDYWEKSQAVPPNLIEIAPRQSEPGDKNKDRWDAIASGNIAGAWPAKGWISVTVLVLWATLAGYGFAIVDQLFQILPPVPPPWLLCVLAGIFPLVDWREASLNRDLAMNTLSSWRRAWLDSIYWTRALGVVLFVFGLCGSAVFLVNAGWRTGSFADAWSTAGVVMQGSTPVALSAAVGMFVALALNKRFTKRPDQGRDASNSGCVNFLATLGGPLIVLAVICLIIFAAHTAGHVVTSALGRTQTWVAKSPATYSENRMPGMLLFLQLAFIYFAKAFAWVGEPMGKANLGSITALQWQGTPAGVNKCLDRWRKMLGEHDVEAAKTCMIRIIRQALWRDNIGFIPVYSFVMLFGLYLGAELLDGKAYWAPSAYLWFILPAVAAIADYLENSCHLRYLSLYEKEKTPNALLTGFALTSTALKTIAFSVGYVTVVLIMLWASIRIAVSPHEYGWRGLIALLITAATLLVVVGLRVWGRIYRLIKKSEKEPMEPIDALSLGISRARVVGPASLPAEPGKSEPGEKPVVGI